jgi:short subunit dehydrogenase-like uncharacterized protein
MDFADRLLPSKQSKHSVTFKSIAVSESDQSKQAVCTMAFKGDAYFLTGVLMAEAAMVLARPDADEENWAQKLRGGILTPATLGDQYVERLQKAGLNIDVGLIGEEPVEERARL